LVDRVNVMYAGSIAEMGSVKDIYARPRHPYTIGLLGSLPRLDETGHERLVSIEGLPPDLVSPPPGCPFAPRCEHVVDRCLTENPELEAVGLDHMAACWNLAATQGYQRG
jgi:oligopeptide transport system ATP-binding protein